MKKRKILVSITGFKEIHWKNRLKELEKFSISEAALFLEMFSLEQRKKIYKALESSCLKKIPLIHIRDDMAKWELKYLSEKFDNPCLTIHESSFKNMLKWSGCHNNLFLEMNFDGRVPKNVDVSKIGGFCIDLSHFKASLDRKTSDFDYVKIRKDTKHYFVCNHLNGYSAKRKTDNHYPNKNKQLDYLKNLPGYVFGDIIAIETFRTIKKQLEFKKYLENNIFC